MSTFKEAPVLTLATIEDVRAVVDQPRNNLCGFSGSDIYRIKSTWLIGIIDEIEASGRYPYNIDVRILAEQRLGLPPKTDAEYATEGTGISTLIYNAQCYRRSDNLRAAGYEPFTPEVVQRAFETKKRIETLGGKLLKVREIAGKLYAMEPRKRNRHFAPEGQPVKIVE